MKIEVSDRGMTANRQAYLTMIVIDGKRYYSRVDRAIVDRYGEMFRRREDKKVLAKLKRRAVKSAQERVTG